MARKTIYEVRTSPIAGRGLFAAQDIPKGTRIVEYLGQRISHKEADRRYDDEKMKVHHTWLFTVDEKVCIDAGVRGNDARFANHSCAPNCEAVNEDNRIFIFARKAIKQGAELLYDYRYVVDPDFSLKDAKRLYPCRCGAPNCRGTIARMPKAKKAAPKKAAAKKATSVGKAESKAKGAAKKSGGQRKVVGKPKSASKAKSPKKNR
jgi:hypothetical protein